MKEIVGYEKKEVRIWKCPMCKLENIQFMKQDINRPECKDCGLEFEWGVEFR